MLICTRLQSVMHQKVWYERETCDADGAQLQKPDKHQLFTQRSQSDQSDQLGPALQTLTPVLASVFQSERIGVDTHIIEKLNFFFRTVILQHPLSLR